ncbi:Regulator of protease activity HflC, stomatin/prohibitin superfamily [Lishizhenia tianjinensis]|uniref:Regulator of protease activity HflC, stomatin/prohibitin superfamily n=1 Tax=Lishizhenia tianjinensis TaxID=477690 RepID=A0A1I6XJC5_9FLAO|nr:SPFH domain-containing protein [Lishizhenia tianjinensis]SFT38203.1 Regulator of protease activity HflC, stomatin/prohibitin superfamily [Lishizhenia tianjinensis]
MQQTDLIFNAAIIAVIFGLIFKSIVIVKEQSSAVIERLGKFNKICPSGLHFIIPFIDRKVDIVNLRVQQLDVGVETKTMDDVFVNLKVSVQFKVTREKVKDAFYSLDNARGQIASYVFDDVRAEVPKLELDDVFAKKDDIAKAVRINIAEIMEEFGYTIIKTLITDIDPDHKVKESMNRINAAKRDKEAAMEVAAARKITIIAEAEAEAESKRLSGEGIARQRLEIVRGFKESVEDFQKTLKNVSHEEVMQFVLLTQYFDTINNVGSNSKNTSILIPHSPGAMQDFQNQIIQGTFIGEKLNEFTDPDEEKDKD